MTVVDLMTAVARTPGSSSSSSAASRDISDTMRCSPQAISTCAITPSRLTSSTTPTSRLRALVGGDEPPAALALERDASGALPAAQRVRAHAERRGGRADAEQVLHALNLPRQPGEAEGEGIVAEARVDEVAPRQAHGARAR